MTIALNPKELITMAIQIEKNGFEYYSRMAEKATTPKVKEMLQMLAKAEDQHIADFSRIKDQLKDSGYETPEEYQGPEIAGYITAMADGKVFSNLMDVEEIAKEIHTDQDAIRHAMSFEKDSIIFFREIHDLLPQDDPNRPAVMELVRQEKIHIAKLYTLMGTIINS